MRRSPSSRAKAVAGGLLVIAGLALVVVGTRGLWPGTGREVDTPEQSSIDVRVTPERAQAAVAATVTCTPAATATEPILPPPPTVMTVDAAHTDPTSHSTPEPRSVASVAALSSPQRETREIARATALPYKSPSPSPPKTARPSPQIQPADRPATQRLYSLRQRLGVCGAGPGERQEVAQQLGYGWYLDWRVNPAAFQSALVTYVPMIRLKDGVANPSGDALVAMVDALPGALWLIGNEPDVKWQDNVVPDAYAQIYHDLYLLLKRQDPTCQVAIGGVSQPTPLRLRYLDQILKAYRARYGEPMPVDVWNVHNFILREERDGWGVDIPPGMTERTGALREVADHDDLVIFQRQVVNFRGWMKERGFQEKPLIVSEYGILMPADYGFSPQQVEQFMLATFDYFRTARDPALGYPPDGYRLVQRWCWFSLADSGYPTGNLVEPDNGQLTPLGVAFGEYVYLTP